MPKNKIKLLAAAGLLSLVGFIFLSSHSFSSKAGGDDVLQEIAKYKTWTKITKEPIKIKIDFLDFDGGG